MCAAVLLSRWDELLSGVMPAASTAPAYQNIVTATSAATAAASAGISPALLEQLEQPAQLRTDDDDGDDDKSAATSDTASTDLGSDLIDAHWMLGPEPAGLNLDLGLGSLESTYPAAPLVPALLEEQLFDHDDGGGNRAASPSSICSCSSAGSTLGADADDVEDAMLDMLGMLPVVHPLECRQHPHRRQRQHQPGISHHHASFGELSELLHLAPPQCKQPQQHQHQHQQSSGISHHHASFVELSELLHLAPPPCKQQQPQQQSSGIAHHHASFGELMHLDAGLFLPPIVTAHRSSPAPIPATAAAAPAPPTGPTVVKEEAAQDKKTTTKKEQDCGWVGPTPTGAGSRAAVLTQLIAGQARAAKKIARARGTIGPKVAGQTGVRIGYCCRWTDAAGKVEGCGMTFARPSQLQLHLYTHTGERPFGCVTCKKTFGTKWALTKHSRIHTAEKPFSCAPCGKTFTQRSSWRRHRIQFHGEVPPPPPQQ